MNANHIRLAALTPDFSRFVDDQVLTAGQLNELVDYLIDQQHASRAQLLGSGILCGLQLRRDGNTLRLAAGVALSSDGDLMSIADERVFSRFRPFDDAEAQYPPLRPGGQLLPMWELHTAASDEPGLRALSTFNAQGGGFANVQALLYLQHYLQPFELCDGNDCDNRGPREVMQLRVLLVQRHASLVDADIESEIFDLPTLRLPRVSISNPDIARYDTNNGLAARFNAASTELREQLVAVLAQATGGGFAAFITALQGQGGDWSATLAADARFNPGTNTRRSQYVYAFFRDLADAYHEWRDSLLELQQDCLPDPANHPRHVLLGEPTANPDPQRRQRFHPGPVVQRNDAGLERSRLLLRRIHQMISFFNPRAFNSANAIRLTPSRSDGSALGERAIPYYFQASDQRPLFRNWSPEAARRRQQRFIPSYSAAGYNPAAQPGGMATNPWGFHRNGTDFIRVEGHIGQPLERVEVRLEQLRRQHNLAFQVLSVQLEDRPERVRLPPRLRFPDLETLFHLQQHDIAYQMRETRSYNQTLRTTLNDTDFGSNEATAEAQAAALMATNLDSSLRSASAAMPRTLAQFQAFSVDQTSTFTGHLSASLNSAGSLNTATYDLFRPTRETPVQRFADGVDLRRFGLLKDLFDRRRRRVRERSIFARFVAENPGLDHLGGVPPGGTLVLVYAADDGEVLADFSLPYYSNFDVSTLEPEQVAPESPDPADPPPVRPPYVLEIPPWGVLNSNAVFTLQGNRVLTEVVSVRNDVSLGLSNFIQGFSLGGSGVTTGPALGGGGGSGTLIGGAFGGNTVLVDGGFRNFGGSSGGVTDPQQMLILQQADRLRAEQLGIQQRLDQGVVLSADRDRQREIDSQLAELVVEGSRLDSLQGDDASLSSGDRAFVQAIGVTAVTIRDDAARTVVGSRFEAINADQPNSVLSGNLGRLAGAFRP